MTKSAKLDIVKLQRAIVDGLEDVKAHDIRVFDTEAISPLFERVMVASGTSNRQTKAIAASVRDKVRDAGFPKPRIEGEANGEWIIAALTFLADARWLPDWLALCQHADEDIDVRYAAFDAIARSQDQAARLAALQTLVDNTEFGPHARTALDERAS